MMRRPITRCLCPLVLAFAACLALMGQESCAEPDADGDGYTASQGDCDDSEPLFYPGAVEVCGSGEDRDCDGVVESPDPEGAQPFYPDIDGDGVGVDEGSVVACEAPDGHAPLSGDNCPDVANPDQADGNHDGAGDACTCDDGVEDNILATFSAAADGGYDTVLTVIEEAGGSPHGARHLRATTDAPFDWALTWAAEADVSAADSLRLAIRGLNTAPNGWQIFGPVIHLQDADGGVRILRPTRQQLSVDGVSWRDLDIPLGGGGGWAAEGDVDLSAITGVALHADTWDAGFTVEIDGLSFESPGEACPATCAPRCGPRGVCNVDTLVCECALGYAGDGCEACAAGYVETDGGCALEADSDDAAWPNSVSGVNGDAWLVAHAHDLERVSPRVLVLNFVNPSSPSAVEALVGQIIAGFEAASSARAFAEPASSPQLSYALPAGVIDLRDGANGRPPAPAEYPYENSTLYPRRDAATDGAWRFDYAALYSQAFAENYGYADPDDPDRYLTLCELVEKGLIHELWVVGSGDVPDVNAAEVLEMKQRYTVAGNPVPGAFERCAGNGCFDGDVPACGRSLRIGWVNYNRGPGCYLHSQGHGAEGTALTGAVPQLSRWFNTFARFDLDEAYGLPIHSLYGLSCPSPPCLSFPEEDAALFTLGEGQTRVQPYDGVCGNVHWPPNGRAHYDYDSPERVRSSCDYFGLSAGGADIVSADLWPSGAAADCGGDYLVWWFQHMPAYGTQQAHASGEPMLPIWPTLFF